MALPTPPPPRTRWDLGQGHTYAVAADLANASRDTQLEAVAGAMEIASRQLVIDLWHQCEGLREELRVAHAHVCPARPVSIPAEPLPGQPDLAAQRHESQRLLSDLDKANERLAGYREELMAKQATINSLRKRLASRERTIERQRPVHPRDRA